MLRQAPRHEAPQGNDLVAPDCHGLNFYEIDPAFRALLAHYMAPDLHAHLAPQLSRLGALAGGKLDELARTADRQPPVLHARDRFGRDEDWIEYHPAYKEMERIALEDFGLHALYHRGGVLGWPRPMGALAKYAIQYLFTQSEFGLMCPLSVTDTGTVLIRRYASDEVRQRYLPGLLAEKRDDILMGAQFMTETSGGSDVSKLTLKAVPDGGRWRLWGDKFFCSHADGDVALLLARTEGAPAGNRGLSLFLMPRRLEDGSRNAYRIVRLKRKLGSSSMASGEIKFEGAVAYLLGREGRGLKQMLDQVNLSRLSHGVRAAAMMRRCLNEALVVARHRVAFGRRLIDLPLLRRQLMKLMLPSEQALSGCLYAAWSMERADAGDEAAAKRLRLLTPLVKFRACRDNIAVATGAMEVRGGNGYVEDWVNARLVRDAHLGVLWEGTSNINALDVTARAVARERAHEALGAALSDALAQAEGLPGQFRGELSAALGRALVLAERVAAAPKLEPLARQASGALYNAMSAVLLAREGAMLGLEADDARRLLLARLVLEHRLSPRDPLEPATSAFDQAAADLLLGDAPVSLQQAAATLAL